MSQAKPPLEEVALPAAKGQVYKTVRRRVTNKEYYGWKGHLRCERAKITHQGQKVWVYRREDQRHWWLDISVVL